MPHDDRTRNANLRRLRKPKTHPLGPNMPDLYPTHFTRSDAEDQTSDHPCIFNSATTCTPLLDLSVSLALSLDRLLTLLDELPMPENTRFELKDLRTEIARELSHFQELRASAALSIAMLNLRRHLGLGEQRT